MKNMKRTISMILCLCCAVAMLGCANTNEKKTDTAEPTKAAITETADAATTTEPAKTETADAATTTEPTKAIEIVSTVSEDTKYKAATVAISPEDFQKAGFTLGDSCDIAFESGYTLTDVPFYNGYYVKNAAPVIVAYPGFTNVSITFNNMGIWETAGLTDGEKVIITLNTAGKYSAVQDSLGQIYSFERKDYTTDEEFCNFRALTGGKLKSNFFFRGASPVDNSRGRAAYTDGLLEKAEIQFIVDLADSLEDIEKHMAVDTFASDYTAKLLADGKAALLAMSSSFQSEAYQQKVAEGMRKMLQAEGPVYIHCMEGKDRTGFVCTLIEALAGASYEEMRADYMITYKNYYKVTPGTEKYDAISELYFDAFVAYLHGTEDIETLKSADYTEDAAKYLMAGGMTAEEVEALKAFLTE